MFENLSERLDSAIRKISGESKLSKDNITEALREVRRALLEADVNIEVVKKFVEDVEHKSLGQEVIKTVTPGQMIVKVIHDELIELMGGEQENINIAAAGPTIIMMCGLQGSGKTTHSAKLANYFKGKGRNPLLVAADTYRPAAIDQLKTLGEQINVPVFTIEGDTPVNISEKSITEAKRTGRDVIIIDTAGRLTIDDDMMNEVVKIKERTHPNEILFVVDAMIGQDAVTTAKAFNGKLNINGVILTKLDGDTRGGAALSIRSIVKKPIKFIGTGEKIEALELFYPDRMASRILGMGDVVSLVEKAQSQFNDEQMAKMEEKFKKNQFNLDDFNIDDKAFVKVESIITSMTKEERKKPEVIDGSRKKRIAKGSGTDIQDVNKLLKQFDDMRKMMRKVAGGGLNRMMMPKSNAGGMMPFGKR
jgi:signal recognition particle subunit SRP54